MNHKGQVFIISGPSGSGKGTIVTEVMKQYPNCFLSVSMTTRAPREGEIDGESYHFIDEERFEKLIAEDGLLEYAGYCGNHYGTPKAPVEKAMAEGKDVILEIDLQGGLQIKAKRPDAVMIFVLPPSRTILEHRLRKRGTESDETIQKRLANAENEIKLMGLYDYLVVNDDLPDAVNDVLHIFRAEHLKRQNYADFRFV